MLECTPQDTAHVISLVIVDQPVPAVLKHRELVTHFVHPSPSSFGKSIDDRPSLQSIRINLPFASAVVAFWPACSWSATA
jgi:hypothetical protein